MSRSVGQLQYSYDCPVQISLLNCPYVLNAVLDPIGIDDRSNFRMPRRASPAPFSPTLMSFAAPQLRFWLAAALEIQVSALAVIVISLAV